MKPNDYLKAVLADQDIERHPDALKALNERRKHAVAVLWERFRESKPTLQEGGSLAKGTMIWDSYDLDIICYFPHENPDGDSIKELYEETEKALQENYHVRRKNCALRLEEKVSDPNEKTKDFHIDVVPGRYIDDSESDVFLHQSEPGKERLKTNPTVHVNHVKNSGVVDSIRLMKLWRLRSNVAVKTFVLELLVIDLLQEKRGKPLDQQLLHVWAQLRDKSDSISVEDPANSGNDLSDLVNDGVRASLASAARSSLELADDDKWGSIFGPIEDRDDAGGSGAVAAAATIKNPIRPYAH